MTYFLRKFLHPGPEERKLNLSIIQRNDTYLITTVYSDVEELDFTHVFSSSSEEAKSSEENIHVCHETDGLYGMTRVTPSASMRIKPKKDIM